MSYKINDHLLDAKMSSKTIKCGIEIPELKKQLLEYFTQTFQLYEKLFTVIKSHRSYYTKPQPLRHPLIFYFGHTAAFFVNKFIDRGIISKRINESYQRMFAVGVDQMDWDDLNESHYQWPSVDEAKKFRDQVRSMVIEIIQKSQQKQINWQSDLWLVLMGIQHERIHLQTSSVIIRRLPIDQVIQHEWFKQCPKSIKQLSKIPKNILKTIKSFQKIWDRQKQTAETYGWDNQFGHKVIKTKEFSASHMLVSNGQFFEFYKDNGYRKYQYWTEEGRNWLKSTKTKKPVFWQIRGQNAQDPVYFLRTITQIIQMPWDWPVQVNNLQAQAFCNWKSKKIGKNIRLPTEDQYIAMRSLLPKDLNNWRHREVGNINLEYWISPNPVNMFQTEGFYDIVGNVWQHTVTPIYPFEGFEIHPNYDDFTTPTFDNRHNLIKGGSFISTGNQALYHSRYAFRRHFYQHAGFRYVESDNPTAVLSAEIDQSDESVEMALKTHFTENQSYIQEVMKFLEEKEIASSDARSLVVGCSVGRLPLELSKKFSHSYGIDYTARYFQMATRLLESKYLKYRDVEINLQNFDMMEQNYNKVHLYQMNPQNTDSKKINQINFMIIDGLSIRKNTLEKAFNNCLKLCTRSGVIQILLIVNKNDQNNIKENLTQHFETVFVEEHELKNNEQIQIVSIKGQITKV